MEAGVAEILRAEHVLHEADHHADAGDREAQMPVDALAEIARDQRRDERAEVDAHVEDREGGVTSDVVRRVQLRDDDRDVAFQQAGAEDDQRQAEIERRQRREGHAEVARRDQDAAVEHGAALAVRRSAIQPPGRLVM
jgi:hypothetical protein